MCPPNKSFVIYWLLYVNVLLAEKLLLYGHQDHQQLRWVPPSYMFYWRATVQLLKVTKIDIVWKLF